MTKRDALLGVLQVSVPDIAIDKALVDNNIDGRDGYSSANAKSIDLVAIDILQGLLTAPDVTEGGYSIRYDRSAIQQRLSYLSQKHGIGSGPTVRRANVW